MCTVFIDEQELQIVEFVKDHPAFYTMTHPDYMNRYQRKSLWQQLADEMGVEAVDVKHWWDTQRAQYRKQTQQASTQ